MTIDIKNQRRKKTPKSPKREQQNQQVVNSPDSGIGSPTNDLSMEVEERAVETTPAANISPMEVDEPAETAVEATEAVMSWVDLLKDILNIVGEDTAAKMLFLDEPPNDSTLPEIKQDLLELL